MKLSKEWTDGDAGLGSPMRLFVGQVLHARLVPEKHVFRYKMIFVQLDIDRLGEIKQSAKFFGVNTFRPLSISEADYLPGSPGSLRERLAFRLKERGVALPDGPVHLVTVPRLFGYVFNPVNFYQCRNREGELEVLIAEVNNTFGETHLYVLPEIQNSRGMKDSWVKRPKSFHVSPFLERKGNYEFSHREWEIAENNHFDLRVDLERDGKKVFVSRLWGKGQSWSAESLKSLVKNQPMLLLSPWFTMPRILAQAVVLRFRKKFQVFARPLADSPDTIHRTAPSVIDRLAKRLLGLSLQKLKIGQLKISYPDGKSETFGDSRAEYCSEIRVKNTNLFSRVVAAGDIGFGESFMAGEWESDHLTRVLETFALNMPYFDDRGMWSTILGRIQNRLKHKSMENSQRQSKKNIQRHYDLSNEFFSLFLDPTLSYSSALYRTETDSLEQAQRNKIARILELAQLERGMHLLEIGSGWGSLAIQAAKDFGVRVTSVTLSERQHELAVQRAKDAGVSHLVDFQIRDYREIRERYDRIVSVEMLEAVGHKYYPAFFKTCDQALKDNGVMVLQVITMPEARYRAYLKSCDWIQKYIFPGGETPSLEALVCAMRKSSGLSVESLDNVGVHYAKTLREWRLRFLERKKEVLDLGFDERFLKMWEYYLAYCEAGFATRMIGTYQMVLTRQGNTALPLAPGYHRE